jgi:hypothetical protein
MLHEAAFTRFVAQGAPRTPEAPFKALYDAVLEIRATGPFRDAWNRHMKRFEQRSGNEPQDFVRKIDEAGVRARRSAESILASMTDWRHLVATFRKSADRVVRQAGDQLKGEERKIAAEKLIRGAMHTAVMPHFLLAHEIGEWARWRARHGAEGKPDRDRMTPLLSLIELIEVGVWFFWAGAAEADVVLRPLPR